MNLERTNLTSVVVFFAAVLSASQAAAQSTISSAPSTDVVGSKQVYVEMDFISNFAWQRHSAFENYIPRLVVGFPKRIEAGVNISVTHVNGGPVQPVEVQPNVKWEFYHNERLGTAGAAGCILYAPIAHRTGTDTLGQCYAVGSKNFSGNLGPRFTGGAYTLIGAASARSKHGAIVGYEQPLFNRFSFLVDWFSGENRFGYVSPGVSIATSKTMALTTGYAIANHGRGNNAFFVYYGKQFQ